MDNEKQSSEMQSTDSETLTLSCYICGTERKVKPFGGYKAGEIRTEECSKCGQKRRQDAFNMTCPPLYLETEDKRLPQGPFNRVMEWTYGPKGLLLMGDSGKGKTRVAWRLLHRVMVLDKPIRETSRNVAVFDCVGFGHALALAYRNEHAEEWLEGLTIIPIIFFDDLGKLKLTERAEAELFGLVERRCARKLPIIATTNDTGQTLADRMTENRGAAMIRRLREFCDVIQF